MNATARVWRTSLLAGLMLCAGAPAFAAHAKAKARAADHDWISGLWESQWPGDQLPKPGEVVADAFDFAAQLLAAQRKFAEDVLQVTTSVVDEAPAEPAKKPAAAK